MAVTMQPGSVICIHSSRFVIYDKPETGSWSLGLDLICGEVSLDGEARGGR